MLSETKMHLIKQAILLAMREINFQEKVGIYSWFKKEKKHTHVWLIVLDKTCEFGKFYALCLKAPKKGQKR